MDPIRGSGDPKFARGEGCQPAGDLLSAPGRSRLEPVRLGMSGASKALGFWPGLGEAGFGRLLDSLFFPSAFEFVGGV